MTYNEKELILQWLSSIEEQASCKSMRHTLKQQYQNKLDNILSIVQQGKQYLSFNP